MKIPPAVVLSGLVGCAPAIDNRIDVELVEVDEECLIDFDAARTTPFLVDLDAAEQVLASIRLEHALGARHAYVGVATIFFGLDEGTLQQVPRSASTARLEPVSQIQTRAFVVDGAPVQRGVSVFAMDASEIAAFRDEPAVVAALTSPSARLPITATFTFTGTIAWVDGDEQSVDPVDIEPTTLTIPIELCSGCLPTPTCDGPRSVLRSDGCFVGVDEAPVCVPSSQ